MKIACGSTHTLALTGTGDVLSWGYGTAGQLGQGRDIDALPNPTLVNFNTDTKMDKIYTGRNHCMAITALTSMVYTWGEGISGQLGYNKRNAYEPLLVDYLTGKNVLKGCLGVDNSAVITTKGDVYVWGSNSSSKLGLSVKNASETFPVLNSNLKNIKTISLGLEHTGVINDKGEVFMWGNNLYGQLGLGDYYSIELPTKMKTNLTFLKVKCAAYHTLFMDNNNCVYVCGKARLNLSTEDYKNKPSPDVIEDFKFNNKGRKIQVGYGNSLVLTYSEEIFGFGKNDYSKAGGELTDEYVMKNARPVTIETMQGNNRKKVAIYKIFANYDSCFALSYLGDVYAWGNPRLFRLTGAFGDEISKLPKIIEIEWLQKGTKNEAVPEDNQEDENDEEDPIINENLDERQILTILNKNLKILSFKELFIYMKRMGIKYDDQEIIRKDEGIIKEITILLSKLSTEFSNHFDEIKTIFMDVDQLFGMRFKELRPPMAKSTLMHTHVSKDILSYIDEVEKIYSYLFIHPCVMRSLLDNIQPEEYDVFMDGIRPLFRGMEIKPKQSENFQSMTYIALVRLSMDIDYISFKSNLDFFCTYKQSTIIELLIKEYLYNYFHRSVLIDILKQSLTFLKDYSNSAKEINNPENLEKVYQVISDKYDRLYFIEPSFLTEVFELTKLFLLDLENNYHKFPHGFIYCFLYMKKYIKKDQLSAISKDKKFLKMKLVSCMMRFFFSNIVGRSLQSIFDDGHNNIFLCRSLNLDLNSTNRWLLENYLKIIGELMERIACNELYNLKTFNREDDEEEIVDEENQNMKSTLNNLNNFIKEMNVKLFVRFIEKFPKMKYNFKKHFISSMVYYNLNITPLKILIEYDHLINFLKFLSQRKSKFSGEMKFEIFELILNEEVHKDKKQEALAQKAREGLKNKSLKLTLDVKHLSNPIPFSQNYDKILETNQKAIAQGIQHQTFKKCNRCHVLLPSVFLKADFGTDKYIKQFKAKVKRQEFIYFNKIFMHQDFKVKQVKTLKDISKNLRYLKQIFEDNYLTDIDEYIYLEPFEDYISDISSKHLKNDEEKMLYFVNDMHNHIRKIINHVYKTSENQKIVSDIEDASLQLKEFLKLFSKNLDECKGSLKLLNNSLDIEEDKEILEATLTLKKKNKPIYTNDNCFRYSCSFQIIEKIILFIF
jgi:alpha-tubulin suppressor-like RCC1 family protein